MTRYEFEFFTNFDPTPEEYAFIEEEYNKAFGMTKEEFCEEWKRNGGMRRLLAWKAETARQKENNNERND